MELLDRFDLDEAADRPAKTYSGGMRRRLDLAAALVAKPEILFLDEPTTGLDPRSRALMWETIQELARAGSTVLLTTQYMEEADVLAERIVVIDRGRKIAEGTSDQLKKQVGGERIEIVLESDEELTEAAKILSSICGGEEVQIDEGTRKVTAAVTDGVPILKRVLQELGEREVKAADIGLRRPTLDDVFLSLTGHIAEEVDESAEDGEDGSKPKRKDREKEAVR
jgi:ABC-2 type transport system ATP-binding protein